MMPARLRLATTAEVLGGSSIGRHAVTRAVRREEITAARGARWITIAMVVVGLLNYGYVLLLTRLLKCDGVLKVRRRSGPNLVGLDRGPCVRALGAGPGSGSRPV